MAKYGFPARRRVVRSSFKKDMLYFALPGFVIFTVGLAFCAADGLRDFWTVVWGLIKQPQSIFLLPASQVAGMALVFLGLGTMLSSQFTLMHSYSGTLVIREDHKLITHGIYRVIRHPIYLGAIVVVNGVSLYSSSLNGFLVLLGLIPVILIRIRLEEQLLTDEYGDTYKEYAESTWKLLPYVY